MCSLINKETLDWANELFEGGSPEPILRWTRTLFGQHVSLATSMQDAVLIDVALKVVPDIDVVFIDTGYHFKETYQMLRRVETSYGITIRRAKLDRPLDYLWRSDPFECCQQRKIQPFREALKGQKAWITGLRRADSLSRAQALPVERDQRGLVKVNPLVAWSDEKVEEYIAWHDVPVSDLVDRGFKSIGCWPCTAPVGNESPKRAGRWPTSDNTECGLHDY